MAAAAITKAYADVIMAARYVVTTPIARPAVADIYTDQKPPSFQILRLMPKNRLSITYIHFSKKGIKING